MDLIEKTDNQLKAWAYIDAEGAIASAKLLDEIRDSGRALGPLHGVPIGLKDIIDTADMPTEFGSVAFKGHQPSQDATIVSKLREAGAVILGKQLQPHLLLWIRQKHGIQIIWNTVRVGLLRALLPRYQQDMCQWPSEHKRMDR